MNSDVIIIKFYVVVFNLFLKDFDVGFGIMY